MQERSGKEIEQLIQYSVGFAKEALSKYGEFYPFASCVGPIGELVPIGIHSGNEFPDSNAAGKPISLKTLASEICEPLAVTIKDAL